MEGLYSAKSNYPATSVNDMRLTTTSVEEDGEMCNGQELVHMTKESYRMNI